MKGPILDARSASDETRTQAGSATQVTSASSATRPAALTKLGVWRSVSARVAYLGDARAALAMVDRGEAAAGIVYASDVRGAARVRVIGKFPADSHPAIVYPLAVIAGRGRPEVLAFYEFLQTPQARSLFEARGFSAPGGRG